MSKNIDFKVEHREFDSNIKTFLCTSVEMSEIVNSLFAAIFKEEYIGCQLYTANGSNPMVENSANIPQGSIYVDLFFADRSRYIVDGKLNTEKTVFNIAERAKAINSIEAKSKVNTNAVEVPSNSNGITSRYLNMMGISKAKGKTYELSELAYDILESFRFNYANGSLKYLTVECETSRNPYTKSEVVVTVRGFDLNKIISMIYGTETEEGRFQYQVIPVAPIPAMRNEFILQITQLDLTVIDDLSSSIGIYNVASPNYHAV